jgi:hypothetical protein
MTSIKVGECQLITNGKLLKIIQIPESQEDYVDIDDPESVISMLRSLRPRPDIFSFWQRLPETEPKYPYYMEWDNVAAIRVRTFDEWLGKSVHSSVRTKLRKGKKAGVSVRIADFDDNLVEGISNIFNESPLRQGRPFGHYGKAIDQVRAEWSVDLDFSVFLAAYFENELIGFVKLSFTPRYAEMSGTICKLKHRDKSPMTALIAGSVQFCESRQIPYLTYGKFIYGRNGPDSLSDFKKYNGFQKVDVPRYYVPLTFRGRVGLALGLHHGLAQRLPSRLERQLRDLRTKYYARRCSQAHLSSRSTTSPSIVR